MFSLEDASEGGSGKSYQKPGIQDNTVISEVTLEKTTKAFVPYLSLKTQNAAGEEGRSSKMFLSNDKEKAKAEGKKTTGWGVTARNLVDLIMATHNVDEPTAKAMIKPSEISSHEDLRNKVSALLVGKPFRGKFKGETTAKGTAIAVLDRSESMRVSPSKLTFDPKYDIKPYVGTQPASSTDAVTTSSVSAPDDLPF